MKRRWPALAILVPLLVAGCDEAREVSTGGDAGRGQVALAQYGCHTCHVIPGVVGPAATVGPPLRDVRERRIIAGLLPNDPGSLSSWIRHPQGVKPGDAMPDLGVTAADAADMIAYLYAH